METAYLTSKEQTNKEEPLNGGTGDRAVNCEGLWQARTDETCAQSPCTPSRQGKTTIQHRIGNLGDFCRLQFHIIENIFSKVKSILRKSAPRTDPELWDSIRDALTAHSYPTNAPTTSSLLAKSQNYNTFYLTACHSRSKTGESKILSLENSSEHSRYLILIFMSLILLLITLSSIFRRTLICDFDPTTTTPAPRSKSPLTRF